jgi:hypothetical protein
MAPRAGLHSQVAFQFRATRDHVRGALNLYAVDPERWTPRRCNSALSSPPSFAITMGWVRHEEDLQSALCTRQQIGVAIGILIPPHNSAL